MEKIHALIIDDDRDIANLFKTVLSLVGYKCEAVYSAKSALVYLATQEPDIVLLDMRLGMEIDGADILYQIRSNPRFDQLRVIVITAYPQMAEHVNSLADLIMLKPVDLNNLETFATRLTQVKPKPGLYRDPVTGLYNLKFFMTRLEHALERLKRNPDLLSATIAIQFEVDFQEGEPLEEESQHLMKRIAERLNKGFRPTDSFGYLGDQRVIALYEDIKKPDDVHAIVRRLRENFARGVESGDRLFHVTPWIGAVLNDPHGRGAEDILEAAIQALELARNSPEGFVLTPHL